jgi:drug/metabolite transporter (DMT)-like permease
LQDNFPNGIASFGGHGLIPPFPHRHPSGYAPTNFIRAAYHAGYPPESPQLCTMFGLTSKQWAHLGLLGTNLFFAINLSAVKLLTGGGWIQPFGLNVVRAGVSALLFWLLVALAPSNNVRIDRADWPRFFLCALTGIAINQMLFLKGLSLTYSIHAVLLMLTTPILITVIAAWLLRERLTLFNILGLGLGVSGATILITAAKHGGSGSNVILGDILVIINAISYTFYFILVKPLMAKYPPITVIRWVFTLGFFMVLPFGWQEFMVVDWKAYSNEAWISLSLVVFAGTFLAYLFNIYGIRALGASVAGAYIYLQPVFATIIAMVVLHEPLEWYKLAAAALIFSGVYLCNRKPQQRTITDES